MDSKPLPFDLEPINKCRYFVVFCTGFVGGLGLQSKYDTRLYLIPLAITMKNPRLRILSGIIALAFPTVASAQVVNYNFSGGQGATFADGSQLNGTMTINYGGTGTAAVTAANLSLTGTRTGTFSLSDVGSASNFYNTNPCGTNMRIYETALLAGGTSLYLDTVSGSGSLIPGTTGVHSSLGYGGNSYSLTNSCSNFLAGNALAVSAANSQYANMTKNAAAVVQANSSNFNIATTTTTAIPRLVNTITSNLTLFTNSIVTILQNRLLPKALAAKLAAKRDAAAIKSVANQAEAIRAEAEAKAKAALANWPPKERAGMVKMYTANYIATATRTALLKAGASQETARKVSQQAGTNFYKGKGSGDEDGLIEEMDFAEDDSSGNKGLWAQPFASFARQNQLNNISPYTANTSGIAAGYDHQFNEDWKTGGYVTYANNYTSSTISYAGNSMVTNMYQIGAYGQYTITDETNVQFTAGIGVNQNSGSRITADNSTASARYNSMPINLGLSLNHSMEVTEKTSFSPTLSANWMSINNNQINETGAGNWNLKTQSNNTNQLVFNLGGTLDHALDEAWSVNATLNGGYAAINPSMTVISAFAGAPSSTFTSVGNPLAPWMGNGGIGVKYATEAGHEFFVNYDAQVREGFLNQTASAKYKYAF